MANDCLCFGVGHNAELAYFYCNQQPDERKFTPRIAAFTCDSQFLPEGKQFCGLPVVAFDKMEIETFWRSQLKQSDSPRLLIATSYAQFNRLRASKFELAKDWGFQFATYISPAVKLWEGTEIGENCLIADNVTLEPRSAIGYNTVIRPGAYIGHHTQVGNHCWISPGAIVCGDCQIGDYSMIAAGAIVRDGVAVAPGTVVGMGAIITKPTTPGGVYLAGVNNLQDLSVVAPRAARCESP